MTLDDALLLVARRADLMARLCERNASGMTACRLSVKAVQQTIEDHSVTLQGLSIACENGPEDTVVAGPLDALETFEKVCKSARANSAALARLDVPFAYHAVAMNPMLEAFRHEASELLKMRLNPPIYPIGSSLRGRILQASDHPIGADYFIEHAREPCRFLNLVEDMARSYGSETQIAFLEMGPSAASKSRRCPTCTTSISVTVLGFTY